MIDDFSSAAIMFTAGVCLTMLMYSWLTPDYDEIIDGHHADLLDEIIELEHKIYILRNELDVAKRATHDKTKTVLSLQQELTKYRRLVEQLHAQLD